MRLWSVRADPSEVVPSGSNGAVRALEGGELVRCGPVIGALGALGTGSMRVKGSAFEEPEVVLGSVVNSIFIAPSHAALRSSFIPYP